jgi:hypothetical protein
MPVLDIPRTVAYGLARPFIEADLFNSHPIPKGYVIVHVDRVKPGLHRSKLEYLERMVNVNMERMLAVTSYGACGTLSLARKTLNLPVQTRHRHNNDLSHHHHHSSDCVTTTTTAATCVISTTIAVSCVATTTTAVTCVATTKIAVSSTATQEDNFAAREDNLTIEETSIATKEDKFIII